MKITKSRLKQIVEEETKKILAEQPRLPGRAGVEQARDAQDLARRQTVDDSGSTTTTGRELTPLEAEQEVRRAYRRLDDPPPSRRPTGSVKMKGAQARLARMKAKKAAAAAAKAAGERETASDWKKDQAMRDNPGEFTSSDIGGIDVSGDSPSDYASGNFGTTSFDPGQEYASQAAADEEAMKASFEKETLFGST